MFFLCRDNLTLSSQRSPLQIQYSALKILNGDYRMKAIKSISGLLPNTARNFNINIEGKNLLIVGGNGSGKTSFLEGLFVALRKHIGQGSILNIPAYETAIKEMEDVIADPQYHQDQKQNFQQNLDHQRICLQDIFNPYTVTYYDPRNLIELKKQKLALISMFPASRKAQINTVVAAMGSKPDIDTIQIDQNLSSNFEQHLVNLRVRSALSAQIEGKSERSEKINKWFTELLYNLRYLFEDDSINLQFDADKLRFRIEQNGKPTYTFQTLSSGYLAIFDIYADLLMRTEYLDVTPAELQGVVLIDEIDVHLHVSLQRKIFPFLANAFPNIQFIATTHSPFVVTSTDDALIYDLSSGSESKDLSMFSIEAVVEGLLGVPSVSTQLLETIRELADITSTKKFEISEAESILNKLAPHADSLDAESRMFYEIAINKVIKRKAEGV
jgi:predicted ATP-binding protein involved in virulence